MTDSLDPEDARIVGRLAAFYDVELRRAQADIARKPGQIPVRRQRPVLAPLVALVSVAAIVVGVVAFAMIPQPTGPSAAAPAASPTTMATGQPSTPASIETSPPASPSATLTASPSPADSIAALRRPLRVPPLRSDGSCPVTAVGRTTRFGTISWPSGLALPSVDQLQGEGPVYLGGLNESYLEGLPAQAGWYGNKFLLATDEREYGRVLLRGGHLDGPEPLGFDSDNAPELIVGDAGSLGQVPQPAPGGGLPPISRHFVQGISLRAPGCYFIQADGLNSSSTIVFRVTQTQSAAYSLLSGNPAGVLLARPVTATRLTGSCPVGPTSERSGFGAAVGDGVVFMAGGAEGSTETRTVWVSTDPAARPVIVRGARLDGAGEVTFKGGIGPTGPFLYLAGESGVSSPDTPGEWRQWPTTMTFSAPGCYEFQIDGVDFTEKLVIQVTD